MDDVVDLGEYARRKEQAEAERTEEERSVFDVWGGEGERTRFLLPLWRVAHLIGGRRSALVWRVEGPDGVEVRPWMVLDLAIEPARIDLPPDLVRSLGRLESPPAMSWERDEPLAIFLGEGVDRRRWFLLAMDVEEGLAPGRAPRRTREDLHFLAGECAGLLFHWELESDPGEI